MAGKKPPPHFFRPAGVVMTSVISLGLALAGLAPSAWPMVRPTSLSLAPVEFPAGRERDSQLREAAREAEQQAGALYTARRYEEALRVQEQSVRLHRELVAQDPSQRLELAASLHNLGVVLIRLGRKADAILPTEESLSLYRTEAAGHAGEVPLAMERPLRNLVLLYFESNRPQEALPLADELVRLHQSMAVADPLTAGGKVDVLNLRASLLVALNRSGEAIQDLQAAVALGRSLAQLAPQNPALRYGLAGSLVNLSQVADLLSQFAVALPPAQEAEALLAPMAQQQPLLKGDWAKALSRLGVATMKVGDPIRARPPLEKAISLLRSLDRSAPQASLVVEVGGYRDDLAHALETLAGVLQRLQRPEEARAAGEEAMAIYTVLAQVDHRYDKDVERTRSWLTRAGQVPASQP